MPNLVSQLVTCWLCGTHVPISWAFTVGHTRWGVPHYYCARCYDSYVASRYDYETD